MSHYDDDDDDGILLGLCGKIGSGKDSAAHYLKITYGFHVISFAGILKDIVAIAFEWDRDLLQGDTEESRKWREEVDVLWSTQLSIPHLTPRWVLQHWGTELIREQFHPDFLVLSLEHKLRKLISTGKKLIGTGNHHRIVITDCRFPNEFELVHRYNGRLIEIKRGERKDADGDNGDDGDADGDNGDDGDAEEERKDAEEEREDHISENHSYKGYLDGSIQNNDTLPSLYAELDTLLRTGVIKNEKNHSMI